MDGYCYFSPHLRYCSIHPTVIQNFKQLCPVSQKLIGSQLKINDFIADFICEHKGKKMFWYHVVHLKLDLMKLSTTHE